MMNLVRVIGILLCLIPFDVFSAQVTCSKVDQSLNMCKGNGYCTVFPIGEDGQECGKKWTVPEGWMTTTKDCFSNIKRAGTFSCQKSGKIKLTICGKSHCYQCICD